MHLSALRGSCLSLLVVGVACSSGSTDDGAFTFTTDAEGDGDGDAVDEVDESGSESSSESDESSESESESDSSDSETGPGPICGDGSLDADEECDDGNMVDEDMCTSACTNAVCGDGFVQDGVEACDDGNDVDDDGCTNACAMATCGNAEVEPGEMCDDGNVDETDYCTNACMMAICGDGHVWAGNEACDDGNMNDDDACVGACVPATCGDNLVFVGTEDCDEGGTSSASCDGDCSSVTCGDGFMNEEAGEECDDGNMNDNDACDNSCASNSTCLNNPQWQPVNCSTNQWVWSSDRVNAPTLQLANSMHVLWTGCSHGGVQSTCSLDGTGFVSTQITAMAGCNATWYHIGGSYTGNCGGHDGDQVRRLALGANDCYAY